MLFLQGTRDALADNGLLETLVERLGSDATLRLFQEADHSVHVPATLRANGCGGQSRNAGGASVLARCDLGIVRADSSVGMANVLTLLFTQIWLLLMLLISVFGRQI